MPVGRRRSILIPSTEPPVRRKLTFTEAVNKFVYGLARHWLALVNTFFGLYVIVPFLAPLLMVAGLTLPARAIYLLYRPACHQRPDRSYFLDGPQVVYSSEELKAAGVDAGVFSRDIGNDAVGWKVAFCERDVAIYGAIFFGGLVYALVRRRRMGWHMRFRYYLLFVVPMALDGLLQMFGLYESTWLVRTLTGTWFGLGSVLLAYPYLDDAFRDVGSGPQPAA